MSGHFNNDYCFPYLPFKDRCAEEGNITPGLFLAPGIYIPAVDI